MRTFLLFFIFLTTVCGAVEYTYNSAGQLLAESYANGAHILYEYDSTGNRTKRQSIAPNASPSANLSISSNLSPDPPSAGSEVTLTITVTNNGPDPATAVTLSETLPASLEALAVTSSQGTAILNGQDFSANLGTIPNGASATVEVRSLVKNVQLVNFPVTVTSPTESDTADNETTVATTPAGAVDLATTIAPGPDPSLTGGVFVPFIVTITNNGPVDATNLVHTLTLPPLLAFSFSDNPNSAHTAGVVTTTLASLAAGASIEIVIGTATGATAGEASVTAAVAADEAEIAPGNNSASAAIELIGSTLTVTNTNNDGVGSLRQAILDANADPGADVIRFSIPGFAIPVLNPSTPLPAVTAPVVIDGFSAEAGVFEINGTGVTNCLLVNASDVTLRGLAFNRATQSGVIVEGLGDEIARLRVFGSAFGMDGGGSINRGNGSDGLRVINVHDAVIGGPLFWQANVFSANGGDGIDCNFETERATIQGNRIGLVFDGSEGDLNDANDDNGIQFNGRDSLIGGANPGEGNIISNNIGIGLRLLGSGNRIEGNIIGMEITGTASEANRDGGIVADGSNNVIGGNTPGQRNFISGNQDFGIDLGDDVRVIGNVIGLNLAMDGPPTGRSTAPGVIMRRDAMLGGVLPGEANTISGNSRAGVRLDFADGENILIVGNRIGTDPGGTVAIPNQDGIFIESNDVSEKRIGLPILGAGNQISGNSRDGINSNNVFSNPIVRTIIRNNRIGTGADGLAALPNGRDGIRFDRNPVNDSQIGGTKPREGNVIAFNGGSGIDLADSPGGVRNAILGNRIHSNGGLGIAFTATGLPHPNDPGDADDSVANLGQNFPVVTIAETSGSVTATLDSAPDTTYRVEFFANTASDPSGNGEGESFLGFAELITDATGAGTVTFAATSLADDTFICATATDPDGNTSEFGPCLIVTAPAGFADSDSDGMSNAYELEHFGTETGGNPATDDDRDGRSNLSEFLALTDPNDSSSFFDATVEKVHENFVILIKTEPGRLYQVEAGTDLSSFTSIGSPVAGDGSIVEIVDTAINGQRFFRISVSVAP